MTFEESVKELTDQGMDEGEARKFLAKDCKVITRGIQLPARHALELLNELTDFGVLAGPVRFFMVTSKDNAQRLLDVVSSIGGPPIVEGTFKPGDSADPIGDFADTINKGYAGSADFDGDIGETH
jgi:hypothetical protein